jgi:hypothetical protein
MNQREDRKTEIMMDKPEWIITKSIIGTASCAVAADTEEEARKLANEFGEWEIDEWEVVSPCKGNVCHLMGIYGVDSAERDDS